MVAKSKKTVMKAIPAIIKTEAVARQMFATEQTRYVDGVDLYLCFDSSKNSKWLGFDYNKQRFVEEV